MLAELRHLLSKCFKFKYHKYLSHVSFVNNPPIQDTWDQPVNTVLERFQKRSQFKMNDFAHLLIYIASPPTSI